MSQEETERVERFLDKAGGPVSEGDVAAGTGIGVDAVEGTLHKLMRKYECALDVREDGTLIYDFGRSLRRLDRPTLWERLKTLGRGLWRAFSFVYKAALAVVLVGYAITFVVMILAAAFAASAASEDGGPAEGALHLVAGVFRAIFEFATWSAVTYPDVDTFGYGYRHYEPKRPVLRKTKREKSFVASVYDFVLGPKRVEPADGAQERETASFVRKNGGTLTVADVQALSGWNRDAAEKFFARFVAYFDGDTDITEDGVLIARFPGLLRSAASAHDEPIIYYWDEYEAPFEVTGNPTSRNVGIGFLAAFNLICAAWVVASGAVGGAAAALGIIPLVLFSLFFLLPMARAPLVWWRNRQQHANNIRKRLFRAVFEGRDDMLAFDDAVARANALATTEEKLDVGTQRPLLERTVTEVGATIDIDAEDRAAMDVSRLRAKLEARKQHAFEVEDAEVVFTTR